MATNICSLCNTELLDNLISCSGRCNKFFHYTCVGISRSIFDGYKKINGLRWQCPDCINEFNGIWTKLDDLTTVVNEIKTMINLCGLVKSTISEALRDHDSIIRSSDNICNSPTNRHEQQVVEKRTKHRRSKGKKNTKSSKPVNSTIIQTTTGVPLAHVVLESSIESSNNTVVATPTIDNDSSQTIRTAESRTYLWFNGFHHETTTNQIINLVSRTMSVQRSDIICRSLKSSRRTYTEFDQVSFRVGFKSTDLKDALTTDRWPKGVVSKLFKSKNSSNRQPVKLG